MNIINNVDRVKELVELSNNSNFENKLIYITELTNYVDNYPICKICGKPIVYSTTKLKITNNKVQFVTPSKWTQSFNDLSFNISVCENCVKDKFGSDFPSMHRYLFMLKTKWAKFIYLIPDDIHSVIKSAKCAVTLQSLINKYGEEIGSKKWDEYRNKQSLTNTFEYKRKKYNWDKEQFDKYNKGRAVTKDNLITKYGEELGLIKWDDYITKQKETKSQEYMLKKFGEEKTNEINKSKAITLSNYIKKYGEVEGLNRFQRTLNRMPKFYSNISQKCFSELDKYLANFYTTYYATKNTEYGVNLGDKYICLDYFIKELNICIEFNGTYFHADPRIFKANDFPNPYNKSLTAEQIWNNDKERYNKLQERGITTYIIWEMDWNNNFNVEEFIKNNLKIKL